MPKRKGNTRKPQNTRLEDLPDTDYQPDSNELEILTGILDIHETNPQEYNRNELIVPLIVTNSKVWVVNYNDEEPIALEHKWVLHRVVINPTSKLPLKKTGDPDDHDDSKYFSIPVVNVKHLKDLAVIISETPERCRIEFGSVLINNNNN